MKLYAAAATVALLLATIQTTPAAAEEQEQENTDSVPENKDEAITEPPIKLVHVLNPGEREYLSPNLIGVQNIAMTFLPLSMNFVNIIDAYREIVNGVQYEILLNAVDTKAKDADTICRLVILEKPWQTTQWGDKHRELVNSNCSDVADNALSPESEERSKALNDKYVSNSIFNGGRRNELSDSDMARLESQILTTGPNGKRRVSSISSSPSTSISSTTTISSAVPQSEPTNEPTTSISVDEAATVPFESDIVDGTTPTPTPTPSSPSTSPTAELNDNEKRWLDDFLSVGAYNFEKTIEQQRLESKQQQEQQQEKQQGKQEQVQDHEEASSS